MPNRLLLALLCLSLLCLSGGARPAPQGCGGCAGNGGSGTASGGACGGMVSISVTVAPGTCKWTADEFGVLNCRGTLGCLPTVTRTWNHLPPSIPLSFCVTLPVEGQLCLEPPPSSGSGSGVDARVSAPIPCGSATRTFTIRVPGCGLEASAQASCSSCNGS